MGETLTDRVRRIQHDHNITESQAIYVAKAEVNFELRKQEKLSTKEKTDD